MMTADQLREHCAALRCGTAQCTDELVAAIEADLVEYRGVEVEQLPPAHLAALLPLMGWLIYESTWNAVQKITDGRRETDEARLADITANHDRIARVANAARQMPWPEYAGRALGAFRTQALAESKRDTEDGYVRAQIAHLEARNRHASALTYHLETRKPAEQDPHLRDLDEMLVQMALAETGTACRVAERVIGRWAEEMAGTDQAEHSQRMFDQLSNAVEIGERALKAADRVKRHHGFVDKVSEEGMALPTSFINPGIMTARAILLMLALYPEMERLGRYPLDDDSSWERTRERLAQRFDSAYEYIERPIENSRGERIEPRDDLKLAIVQIRLSAALLMPGRRLTSSLAFTPCVTREVLDEDAVEAMCGWLTEPVADGKGGEKQRSVLRGLGSATMPDFIQSTEACRLGFGAEPGYRDWRARWFVLDAYAHESGRDERVSAVLGRPVRTGRPI